MNRQEFTQTDSYPLSTQTMSLLQDSIMAVAELSRIGGENYILSGCVQTGNSVTSGTIVIKGEPMPFEGGAAISTITIVETEEPVLANGISYPKARIKRYAKFASGTGATYLSWANFKPLPTNQQLQASKAAITYVDEEIKKIAAYNVPKGAIVMWSGSEVAIPTGWCLCDGRTLQDGNNVPDLRGRFIVGYNSTTGSGYDKIRDTGGNKEISLSPGNTPRHRHLSGMGDDKTWPFAQMGYIESQSASAALKTEGTSWFQGYTSFDGDAEPFDIRPPYYVLAFIIKL